MVGQPHGMYERKKYTVDTYKCVYQITIHYFTETITYSSKRLRLKRGAQRQTAPESRSKIPFPLEFRPKVKMLFFVLYRLITENSNLLPINRLKILLLHN